jgi:hypothetical protein
LPPISSRIAAPAVLTKPLGAGQCCVGYEHQFQDGTVGVIKVFSDLQLAMRERQVCALMNGTPNVAQLCVQQPTEANMVAMHPKGVHFGNALYQRLGAIESCNPESQRLCCKLGHGTPAKGSPAGELRMSAIAGTHGNP